MAELRADPQVIAMEGVNARHLSAAEIPEAVGKGGVVKDETARARVRDEVSAWFAVQGWTVDGIVESPILGAEGNVEFLIGARR